MNCAKNKLVCASYKLTIPKIGCTKQMLVVKVDINVWARLPWQQAPLNDYYAGRCRHNNTKCISVCSSLLLLTRL